MIILENGIYLTEQLQEQDYSSGGKLVWWKLG